MVLRMDYLKEKCIISSLNVSLSVVLRVYLDDVRVLCAVWLASKQLFTGRNMNCVSSRNEE